MCDSLAMTLGAHLEPLDAAALRELILELSAALAPAEHARLVDLAARKLLTTRGRGALPPGEDPQRLAADVSRYARSMKVAARGDPSDLDALFARLNAAWLRGEHMAFRAGMMDIAAALDGGVDLGHDELYSEVLSTNVYELAHRLLVSVYLTTPAGERAVEIDRANDAMDVFMATEQRPIRAMEQVALEPLPDLDELARAWTAHLRAQIGTERARRSWAFEPQLREATSRSAGTSGLAELARTSKGSADYEAWAEALRAVGDPAAAAQAAREGAQAMSDGHDRAHLLSFAARIELGRHESSEPDLRGALLADPTALRLRRWLASVPAKTRGSAVRGLDLKAKDAAAMVIVSALRSDWPAVAKRLAKGAPLGWSGLDHGGSVGVEAVVWALAPTSSRVAQLAKRRAEDRPGLDDPGAWLAEDVASRAGLAPLAAPTLTELLDEIEPSRPTAAQAKALRDAVSKAALARVEGVAASARRSRYGDAARLVALAAALHAEAGDTKAAEAVVSKARAATGRKWSFTEAIDRAVQLGSRS